MNEENPMAKRDLLCLSMGEVHYGLALENIIETLRNVQVTAVLGLPAYFCGVCNRKGTITPVLRLDRLLGAPDEAGNGSPVTVMVRSGEYECGLMIWSQPVILPVTMDQKLQGAPAEALGGACVIGAVYNDGSHVILEVDIGATLADLVVYR